MSCDWTRADFGVEARNPQFSGLFRIGSPRACRSGPEIGALACGRRARPRHALRPGGRHRASVEGLDPFHRDRGDLDELGPQPIGVRAGACDRVECSPDQRRQTLGWGGVAMSFPMKKLGCGGWL